MAWVRVQARLLGHRVAAPRGSTAEQAHVALAGLLHIPPDDALGRAVSGAHVLLLAVQAPEVDLRTFSPHR